MKTRLTYNDLKRKMGLSNNKASNIITLEIDGEMVQFEIKYGKNKFQLNEQQFNQMLTYAIQAYRNGYDERGLSCLETLLAIIYPDNGEIWNPIARILFKQYFYVILDTYMSKEYTIRNIAKSNNIPSSIIDNEIDNHYKKFTFATMYLNILLDCDGRKISDTISDYRKNDTTYVQDMAILSNETIKTMVSSQKSINTIYKIVLNGLEQIEK